MEVVGLVNWYAAGAAVVLMVIVVALYIAAQGTTRDRKYSPYRGSKNSVGR